MGSLRIVSFKGKLRSIKVKLKWKSVKNEKKTSHRWPQCIKWFSRYSNSKSGTWARWTSPFCRFSPSFSLKYDVTDAILQDNEKWKWNISGGFCSICLKLCRLLGLTKWMSLHLKFRCCGSQKGDQKGRHCGTDSWTYPIDRVWI